MGRIAIAAITVAARAMTVTLFTAIGTLLLAATVTAQQEVSTRMMAWSRALGVECTHCHVDGSWTDASRPAFEFARRMERMVAAINAGPLNGVAAISCWTCHRGRTAPPRLPRESWESIRAKHISEFGERPDLALTMSVYAASLGVDCSHCHEPNRRLNTKAPKAVVATMMAIFDEIPKHFDAVRRPVTQCYMCHQGRTTPER